MTLIDDLDAVKQVDSAIAENSRLQAVYVDGRAREIDGYTTALAEHQAAVETALDAGEPPPDAPPEPASQQMHMDRLVMFQNRASMLRERRLQVIAANRADIDLLTNAMYADKLSDARKHVTALTRIGREITELQQARHEAACAAIETNPSQGGGASRPPAPVRVDAEAVVAAVTRGVDLFEQQVERQLGMTGNLHEIRQPPAGSEPKPGGKPLRTSATVPQGYTYGR